MTSFGSWTSRQQVRASRCLQLAGSQGGAGGRWPRASSRCQHRHRSHNPSTCLPSSPAAAQNYPLNLLQQLVLGQEALRQGQEALRQEARAMRAQLDNVRRRAFNLRAFQYAMGSNAPLRPLRKEVHGAAEDAAHAAAGGDEPAVGSLPGEGLFPATCQAASAVSAGRPCLLHTMEQC